MWKRVEVIQATDAWCLLCWPAAAIIILSMAEMPLGIQLQKGLYFKVKLKFRVLLRYGNSCWGSIWQFHCALEFTLIISSIFIMEPPCVNSVTVMVSRISKLGTWNSWMDHFLKLLAYSIVVFCSSHYTCHMDISCQAFCFYCSFAHFFLAQFFPCFKWHSSNSGMSDSPILFMASHQIVDLYLSSPSTPYTSWHAHKHMLSLLAYRHSHYDNLSHCHGCGSQCSTV